MVSLEGNWFLLKLGDRQKWGKSPTEKIQAKKKKKEEEEKKRKETKRLLTLWLTLFTELGSKDTNDNNKKR